MAPYRETEISPGEGGVKTDDEIDAHIRRTAMTAHHPGGTCRMGTIESVVDPLCASAASKDCG